MVVKDIKPLHFLSDVRYGLKDVNIFGGNNTMKATVEFEFEGCHDGCPYLYESGVMMPEYCHHPDGEKPYHQIIGFSTKSNQIPEGKKHPDWCPVSLKKLERIHNREMFIQSETISLRTV